MNNNEIHKLIELYFDGLTTLDQERQLRDAFASMTPPYSPDVESAMAVMGYTSVMRHPAQTRLNKRARWMAAAAAAVSLFMAVAIAVMMTGRAGYDANSCVAYVGGVKVSSQEQVMEIMDAELSSISKACDGFDNEVLEQKEAFSEIFNQL